MTHWRPRPAVTEGNGGINDTSDVSKRSPKPHPLPHFDFPQQSGLLKPPRLIHRAHLDSVALH